LLENGKSGTGANLDVGLVTGIVVTFRGSISGVLAILGEIVDDGNVRELAIVGRTHRVSAESAERVRDHMVTSLHRDGLGKVERSNPHVVLFFYWRKFLNIETLKKLFAAFIPTAIIGLVLSKFLKALLTNEILIAVNLIIGGIIIILVERWYERKFATQISAPTNEISFKQSFILGIAQALAIFPGVSRSGAVIVSGLLMKIDRKTLAEFTFLLAVPTMFAATFYSLLKHREILDFANLNNLFLGFVFAFITALVVIKYFLEYIKKHNFIPFGIYRIIVGIFLLFILL
jgi:undecaprenyl-diphosphatase